MKPRTTNAAEWHAHIAAAPNFADAQDRMEDALRAGVDFFALRALPIPPRDGS